MAKLLARGLGLVFSDLGLRKQGFALDWMLPTCRCSPMISSPNTSYLEGWEKQTEAGAELAQQQCPLSARMGMLGMPAVSLCSHGPSWPGA